MDDKATTMEFAVDMTCKSCEDAVIKSLHNIEEVKSVKVDLSNKQVFVTTTLPSGTVHKLLESTGKAVIFRGHGYQQGHGHLGAAVCILQGNDINGVVRLVQLSDSECVIDGTIDGLTPGCHGFNIHESGDLRDGCKSTGAHFDISGSRHGGREDDERHIGDLGNIKADASGTAIFRFHDDKVKVWDVIGRSIVVHEDIDDLGKSTSPLSQVTGNSGKGIACGIIARSAGLLENTKKICACSGRTLWEENQAVKETLSSSL